MKFALILPLIVLQCLGADSFITKHEYGAYLYNNPRGIGCNHCHGKDASGKLIAKYRDQESQKVRRLRGPDIQNVDKKSLIASLRQAPSAMPTYNLTDEEIEALYLFLNSFSKD